MLQPERHGSSNFDASLQAFFLVARQGFGALSGSQNSLGLLQAGLPGFCQGQASGGAVKQRYVSCFSNLVIALETVGWDSPRTSAAWAKDPVSATVAKMAHACRSGNVFMSFLE
jgi:hypothetical protein